MKHAKEYRTSWAKEGPLFGAFDDYIILESLVNHQKFFVRPEEFDFIMREMLEHWEKRKSKYVQVLKEWNECIGFESVEEDPSIIIDNEDFIDALKLIKGVSQEEFGKITSTDLKVLIKFLMNYKNEGIMIRKE